MSGGKPILNPIQFGADPTGVIDSAPAIQRALDVAYATGANYVEITPGDYLLDTQIRQDNHDGVHVMGIGRPRMVLKFDDNTSHPKSWYVGNDNQIDGILFDDLSGYYTVLNRYVIYCAGLGVGRATVISNCRFTINSGYGIVGDVRTTSMTVKDNTHIGGSGGVFLLGNKWCRVIHNYYQGVARPMQMYGGQSNIIAQNNVEGGNNTITGILFLSERSIGALVNTCYGNVVSGNTIFNCSEEGISFDGHYNDHNNWSDNSTRPVVTVGSLTTPSPANAGYIRINTTETGQGGSWANNFYAIPLNGNALAQPMFVVGSGNGYVDVERSNGDPPLTAGDKIVIQSGFVQNVVTGNTLDTVSTHTGGAGEGGIVFWGAAWGNVIADNTIRNAGNHGINISSQVQTLGSSPNWFAQGWSGYNIIHHNTILLTRAAAGAGVAGYPIKVYTKDYGGGALVTAIHTPGVQVTDNIILSQNPIWINDNNDAWVSGNKLLYSSGIIFDACTNCRFGRNYKLGVLMTGPTETGGTAGTIKLVAAAQADLAGAPGMADFNTLLANRRAAEEQAP